jgi:4-amino-4-deoxy-L-arabinose transferase-like glycosyltransferase
MGNLKIRTCMMIVAMVAVVERVLLYLFYRPVAYSDTGGYRRAVEAILGDWNNLDGTRTPGYPVFIALFGPDERVYAAQLALGLVTTLLVFYVGWRISQKGWFGVLAALVHSLNLGQFSFEANLISECLTTFLIVVSLALMAWLFFSDLKTGSAKHHFHVIYHRARQDVRL